MTDYLYLLSLGVISLGVAALEWAAPKRPHQRQLRKGLGSDLLHLAFNGHFLGVIMFGIASRWILPALDEGLAHGGLVDHVYRNTAAAWPLWVQVLVALVGVDFLQWCVHNALHRVPWLWETHKCHHSVEDGEMDWIVAFRFQWSEVVIYRVLLYLPLAWFGFAPEAVLFHAIFGTLIGHLNHSNTGITWGPLRYVLNSPVMHIWHHDFEGGRTTTKNFGIIFSTWDWIFGTAYMPDAPPKRLGLPGVETFPKGFFAAAAWPLPRLLPERWLPTRGRGLVASMLGGALVLMGWYLHHPASAAAPTPMLGESRATSQPAELPEPLDAYAGSPTEARAALQSFGADARAEGYAHPEAMVSVRELASALGASRLVLLDVRPEARFRLGRIPSARPIFRDDFSASDPVPGMSADAATLENALRARGISHDSVVVAYTDGGPEAYRLWWTLRARAGYDVRILDGGMQAWVARGHALAAGEPPAVVRGDITLEPASGGLAHWADVEAFVARTGALLVDTREGDEFTGEVVKEASARGGHIPSARHLEWWRIVRDVDGDHRLAEPETLRALLDLVGSSPTAPMVIYCQSGTRSSALYFALYQLGADDTTLQNYDGSWAEYSRLFPEPSTSAAGNPPG